MSLQYSKRQAFGFFCPAGGNWYSCAVSRFVGCCTSDPCSKGCPEGNIRPGSFDRNVYGLFSNANCSQANSFYTCTGDGLQGHSPFWGCCLSMPCGDNPTCSDTDLEPAILDMDNAAQVENYRPTGASTSTAFASSTTAAGTTTSTTASATAAPLLQSGKKPSAASIGGGVAAGVALVIIAILAFFYLRRRRARKGQGDEAVHPASDIPTFMADTSKYGGIDLYNNSKLPPSSTSYTVPPGQSYPRYELPAETIGPHNMPFSEHRLSELSGDTARRSELESPWQSPVLQSGWTKDGSAVASSGTEAVGPGFGNNEGGGQ